VPRSGGPDINKKQAVQVGPDEWGSKARDYFSLHGDTEGERVHVAGGVKVGLEAAGEKASFLMPASGLSIHRDSAAHEIHGCG